MCTCRPPIGLSTVRWAQDHAVKEILGLASFDEEDLYQALEWAAANQQKIENKLFRRYVNVADQIDKLANRVGVKEVVFIVDRGMVKAKAQEVLKVNGLKYITAITDPQIRVLIRAKIIQQSLFDSTVLEVESDGKRYVKRRDDLTFRKEQHRRENKLQRLEAKVSEANLKLVTSKRATVQSNIERLQAWSIKYYISSFVSIDADGRTLKYTVDSELMTENFLLDFRYVITTNVDHGIFNSQQTHDPYKNLQNIERDFRSMKTGLLEVRPIFLRKKREHLGMFSSQCLH